jgi:hypothetical protein
LVRLASSPLVVALKEEIDSSFIQANKGDVAFGLFFIVGWNYLAYNVIDEGWNWAPAW